ncbi:MAG: sigma-54-dependent Fis family transcriptional regulator [Acetobacteraceae bacterium]|nr:sigma-54-dependent Fis family transcriptional regulator [Acetobacteraceae bacterium]
MRILIIGALSGPLEEAARIARAQNEAVDHATTLDTALVALRRNGSINVVFCELPHDISTMVRALAAERIFVPVVACGIDVNPDIAADAIRAGAREYLPLPPSADMIAELLTAVSLQQVNFVVQDRAMLDVLKLADRIARAEASVLITGESGTGKEMVARHLHRASRRSAGPFVALNCAAIPENLLESELFGHEKGAFSGALARRIGKFESANGGTLLLDEIGEMDINLQSKLLRALQEREIERLGGNAPVKIDVRILAATNRDLAADAAAGRFRDDLYFRLNVIRLHLPPLRDRPADIAALADHFAHKYAELNGLPHRRLTVDAYRLLENHAWRGNVRELENCIHRAVLLSVGDIIGPDAIELAGPQSHRVASAREEALGLVGMRVEEVERDLILQTLSHTLGNRTRAAVMLGISIRALRNKLRDYSAQGLAVPPPVSGIAA